MKSPVLRAVLLVAAAMAAQPASAATFASSVVATGLNNPRGLVFGPDGALYIAEAGVVETGGPTVSVIRNGAPQTFHVSNTGSITRLHGTNQQRIVTGLPSIGSLTVSETTGPSDIAFGADGRGYFVNGFITDPAVRAALGPAGAHLGKIFTFTGVPPTPFADISALESSNPAGRELNSNPYNLAALSNGLLVTDAGSNTLLRVASDGTVSNVATFLARPNGAPPGFPPISDSVPTGVAVGPDGAFYVAELTGFPFVEGAARIYRITEAGEVSIAYTGFTNIADIAFGADGSLYVLELDSNGLATPGGSGRLLRAGLGGVHETLFSQGLVVPTGLTIGADKAFYITNFSSGPGGSGEVLRVAAVPEPQSWAMMILGFGVLGIAVRRRVRRLPATV